ncbi:hypothetical protein [Salegentibacter salarius]|uniref:hypothetical protein n=1 Tax=Salegentibacter salarius TaxID=435906 RepID=UPI0009A61FF7|nr:hypothetical protein [Salegentibacter salarius]SLJ89762.1 hypothetical protein SAMN05660445_00863 [Salegentibacter salarius]SLK06099.1 hypothetical protein SAMN05660445_03070 [Salegentibacter salarius]
MKIKAFIISLTLTIISFCESYGQEGNLNDVEYTIIAKGTDSPIPDLQIVCFNKYFNKDYLPSDFRKKYNLDEKRLYKKKMLVELFHSDTDGKGLDEIELIGIQENDENLIVNYNVINSDTKNDEEKLSPFLIVQVPKSKKDIKFVVNGSELGKGTELYVD